MRCQPLGIDLDSKLKGYHGQTDFIFKNNKLSGYKVRKVTWLFCSRKGSE